MCASIVLAFEMEIMQNLAQISVPHELPVYKPLSTLPAGQYQVITLPAWPMAEPRQADAIVTLITIGAESEIRQAAAARRGLHEIFRWLTAQPARVPATDIRRDYAHLVEWSERTGRPVFVTNHGRPEAVLLSFGLYGRILKSIARIASSLASRRPRFVEKADELIEAETKALSKRLRQGETG